ncbi:MAG: hypothetical protein BGO43_05960 [Gammaproteobacteria bacterium 39-13]|nr:hypothetical protein [Gammaproteobacteria bacterium]OJV90397.1 MAG: hypothetical protein BGO43_05960 [Gammaproteobacteria bacterium 39-13]
MTPEQVQFCYDIAQGRQDLASSHLFKIKMFPRLEEIIKKTNFELCPAIFCLWAAGQKDPSVIAEQLQQLYPQAKPPEFQAAENTTKIHQAIRELVFPLIKRDLLSLLKNFNILAGVSGSDKQHFNLVASAEALHLILHDEFFADVEANKLEITSRIYKQFRPHADLNDNQDPHREIKSYTNEKPVPDAIKSLIAALNNQSRTELPLEFSRTYLPSGYVKREPYLRPAPCREEERKEDRKCLLMSPVH